MHSHRNIRATTCILALLALPATSHADCAAEARIATHFINGYVRLLQAEYKHRTRYDIPRWLKTNPLVAPSFINAYRAKEREGLRRDSELGWDMDMILAAQDYPDKGFEFQACGNTPGIVRLTGADGNGFTVIVRVEPTPKKLHITGAGMVNIPSSEMPEQ